MSVAAREQSGNRKLHDIATQLALTGLLPDEHAPTEPDDPEQVGLGPGGR